MLMFLSGELTCDPRQMSGKGMKPPAGTHTPPQMLLAAGVSVMKLLRILLSPFAGISLS